MIKYLLFAALIAVTICPDADARRSKSSDTDSTTTGETTQVNGYFRKDGTYVAPHYRSAPDSNFNNNWTTKGNYNPYTGTAGTRVTQPAGYGGYTAPAYQAPTYTAPRRSAPYFGEVRTFLVDGQQVTATWNGSQWVVQ